MINLKTPEQASWGRVCDMSKSGLSAILPLQFAPADLVQLEMADSVLLGRVAYSIPEGPEFRTGIALERVQLGDSDLSNLLQEIPGKPWPVHPDWSTPKSTSANCRALQVRLAVKVQKLMGWSAAFTSEQV